ncbi:MAG: ABC transporter ATP-binding protein, partial [Pseudomonadota bacterium]
MTASTVAEEPAVPEPDEAKETLTSGIAALAPFAYPSAGPLALSALLAVLAALLGLVPYWAVYKVAVVLATDQSTDGLWSLGAIALGSVLARFLLSGVSTYIAHGAAFEIQYRLRLTIAEHLARVPLGYVNKRRSGELKKVMADDVERLELFLAHAIPDLTTALVTFLALFGWMLWVDWRLALAAFALVLPAFAAIAYAMRRSGHHTSEYKTTQGLMNAAIVELVRGMPVVKIFNRAEDQVRGTEQVIARYVDVVKRYSLEFLPFGTAFYVLLGSNVLLILPVGGWLWTSGSITTEVFLFFLIIGLGALSSLVALLFLFANLSHIASGGTLVTELLAQSALSDNTAEPREPEDATLRFADVSFRYDSSWALRSVSFVARPGTLTAVVGASGSGKSTIAALTGRFWDPQMGQVEIGGVSLPDIAPDTLYRQVSLVLQEAFLFDDTVLGNLRLARPDASHEQIQDAARRAQIHDRIEALPKGYDTPLGEHGVRLSGGERQRLTIARAILADTPIIVLDEATAFVDPENETLLQAAISALVEGKTVLMIAHRLSTVAGADQILVM